MTENQTIGDIVSKDIRTASVFKKYGLDFCCGGGKKLITVCEEKGVNLPDLLTDLEFVTHNSNTTIDYRGMPLDDLVDYIFDKHHQYIYEFGPITAEFVNKVARVHGERNPETVEIAKVFNQLLAELHHHMMKEEQVLFPYIKNLMKMDKGEEGIFITRQFVSYPIRVMGIEHENAGSILRKLKELSDNYEPPVNACNTYRAAYANLNDMENDIHLHIHLENNILFPKTISLESKIIG